MDMIEKVHRILLDDYLVKVHEVADLVGGSNDVRTEF